MHGDINGNKIAYLINSVAHFLPGSIHHQELPLFFIRF
jgi:hypothetical protein